MKVADDKRRGPNPPPVAQDGALPPHDLDMEKDVLATCMEDRTALLRAVPILARAEQPFFGEQNEVVWGAMRSLAERRQPVELNTVRSQLLATGLLARAGGATYLAALTESRPVVENVEEYADRLVELWEQRDFLVWCGTAGAEGRGVPDFRRWRAEKQRELTRKTFAVGTRARAEHVSTAVVESMSAAQQRKRHGRNDATTPTGYTGLDRLTGGIADGAQWIFAGRPGQGKTALLLGMAANITRPVFDNEPIWIPRRAVALFELEMGRIEVVDRMVCMAANIPLARWRNGPISDDDMAKAGQEATTLVQSYFWIDESPPHAIGIAEIEAKVMALKAEYDKPATFAGCPICPAALEHSPETDRWFCPSCHPNPRAAGAYLHEERVQLTREQRITVTLIDHLGLVAGNPDVASRERQIAEITGGSKAMAKRLKIGVVNASQLNREADKRDGKDKRPKLSDIRESGSAEQDADVVVFPYRPGYYRPDDVKLQYEAEFIVAKQRNGPPGTVPMRFIPECAKFEDPEGPSDRAPMRYTTDINDSPLPEGL